MIPRWMPYSTPIYIEPLRQVFERLQAKVEEQIELEKAEDVQDFHQDIEDSSKH